MASPTGQEIVTVQGVYNNQPAATTETFTLAQVAALGTDLGNTINTNITTAGNGTLTAAAIVGNLITRSGPTANYTDTTDTAANIVAALPSSVSGASFEVVMNNTVGFTQTILGGTGVSITGLSGPISANSNSEFLVTVVSAASVSMQITRICYNATSGYDPSTVATQFGSGTGTFLEEGNINRQIFGTAATPAGITNDYCIAIYSLPANSFDGIGNRGINFTAAGSFASTTNVKTAKIIFNPAIASVGNIVGAGGTTIATTGAVTNSNAGWVLQGQVFKYGVSGSNTQYGQEVGVIVGSTHGGCGLPSSITANESAAINIVVTGNAATITTDILLNFYEVNVMN